MAVRKTHVKSDKRIKREKEQKEAASSAKRHQSKKNKLGSKKTISVDTRFKFKSQAERYKDISVDLASLIEDAVERFGRWDVQPTAKVPESKHEQGMDADSAGEESEDEIDEDMITSPISIALAELALLNTSLPFQSLHKALYPITRSLPLILHNKQPIANLIVKALTNTNRTDLALSAPHIIDLIPSFIQCLTPDPDFKQLQLDTILTPLVRAVVGLAVDPPSVHIQAGGDRGNDPSSPVEISKRAFQVLAWTLRQIGRDLVNGPRHQSRQQIAWSWVVEGLNGSRPIVEDQLDLSETGMVSTETDTNVKSDGESYTDEETEENEAPEANGPNDEQQVEGIDSGIVAETVEVELVEMDDSETAAEESDHQHQGHALSTRRRPLSSTKPHLRRLLATCFAFLLRRTKSREYLDSIAMTVLQSLQTDPTSELCQSISWLILESVKSVESHIHSRGPAILEAFIGQACKLNCKHAIQVLCAALTGIVHHAKVETLSGISQVILVQMQKSSTAETVFEKTLRLELVLALLGTRRGSRLSDKDKSSVLSICEASWVSLVQCPSIIPLTVETAAHALLNAPSLQSMLDSGRKLLEKIWSLPPELSHLTYAAVDLLSMQQWVYFQDFAVPLIKRAGKDRLGSSAYVSLLAELCSRGQMPSLDTIFTEVERKFAGQIATWSVSYKNGKVTQRQSQDLVDSLALCSSLARHEGLKEPVLEAIQAIIQVHPTVMDARRDFMRTPTNSSAILAALLRCLASIGCAASLSDSDFVRIIERFHWHRDVLQEIASMVNMRSLDLEDHATGIYDICKDGLLSQDTAIRKNTLVLLQNGMPTSEILRKALEVEKVPLTPQDAREKNMQLRRLGIAIKNLGEDSTQDIEIGLFYLFAMLKVNFKPLWSETIEVIAQISKAHPRSQLPLWTILSRQLYEVARADMRDSAPSDVPPWATSSDEPQARTNIAPWRQNDLSCTAFARCSSSYGRKLHHFLELSTSLPHTYDEQEIQTQLSDARLSHLNFEAQLLALARKMRALTEQHSRDFLELFFEQFGQHDLASDDNFGIGGNTGRERLCNWLKVIAEFKNPKALYRSNELYEHMLHLLSHGDSDIQGLALDSILTWRSPNFLPYEVNFRNLLQSAQLRDELLHFSIAEDTSDIMPERREQVVNITIRILFGLMSSRQGRASAINVQRGRKSAVLNALKACRADDLDVLVDLMSSAFKDQVSQGETFRFAAAPLASIKQQLGFLALLGDTMTHLAEKLRRHWDQLFQITLNLAYNSRSSQATSDRVRHIRQLAFRRLADFFRADASFDASRYLPSLFADLISPRLSQFGAENAQGPSALLELIATWASYEETAFHLVKYDNTLLPSLYSTLGTANVKDSVILRILDVVQRLLLLSADNVQVQEEVLTQHIDPLLSNISHVLATRSASLNVRDQIGVRLISLLSNLSPFIATGEYSGRLLPLLFPLLNKPNMLIPESVKADLLKIMTTLLPGAEQMSQICPSDVLEACYSTVCALLGTMRTRTGRLETLAVFRRLQIARGQTMEIADFLEDLNAFSTKRMDVPDFDRRLSAFQALNEHKYKDLRAIDWIPILSNMFYYIQDTEEMSIRSNANAALRRFVQVAGPSLDPASRIVFSKNFMPALRRALRSKIDLVRIESISVLHAAVRADTGYSELDEMKCLLTEDEESSFFNNIYHIQSHRRARALRRLAEEAEAGSLSSKTINDIFLPLVAYNLAAATDSKSQEVINETVTTIGRLASALHWGAYHRLLQQYLASAAEKRENQKIHVRVLVAILKGFSFDLDSMPVPERLVILTTIQGKLMPRLLQFLQARNETEEALRIPVAEGIAVILQRVPPEQRPGDVTSLITALAQILRSKSQEVRDMTRNTLCNIAVYLGAEYLSLFVKELRASLAKGPHLHVLAFVLHALLERLLSTVPTAIIDECLGDAVPIIYDDLLGYPAKDRQSTEFRSKTKYREVRLCKSMDSIELLAAHVSPNRINALIGPLRSVLSDGENVRVLQSLDDILRHTAAGLQRNPRLDNGTLLTLCQALISQNTDFLKPRKPKSLKDSLASKEYLVQVKRITQLDRNVYAQNAHKFVAFGLDLLNGAFRKNRFDVSDELVVSRLDPLITLVGNTLFADEAHILDRALRAVSSLIRCPLASIEKASPVLVKQMISILENMGGTVSDLSQTTMRTLATLIRDRKTLDLTEEQLTTLVDIITPDLEEPEQQAALFSLLRAVVSRKFVSPEMYDLMDRVAEILIASQSHNTREICRSIYLQFLLDYPQGKKRLSTTMHFLVKNLSGYVHESGRMSALELVNAILAKFDQDLLDQFADLFHIALVMALANDESAKCRSMSAENCKILYGRVSKPVRQRFLATITTWGEQEENPDLAKVAAQASGLMMEAFQGKIEVDALSRHILPILLKIVIDTASRSSGLDEALFAEEVEEVGTLASGIAWQPAYQALASLHKISRISSTSFEQLGPEFHHSLRSLLVFPHTWVRQASSRLLGAIYSIAPDEPTIDDLIDAASASTTQLKSKHLDDTLALQIVKNLFFIGKRFARSTEPGGGLALNHTEGVTMPPVENPEADTGALANKSPKSNPFHWLFVKLSHRARVAHQMKPSKYSLADRQWKWSTEPMSILRWFAAMISEPAISAELLAKQTHQIVLPIVRMIEDPNGAQDPQMDDLQALAREVHELLCQRVGVSPVTEAYSKVQRSMTMKREGRRQTVALHAVNNPEAEAQRRAKKNESTLKNRKRKNESYKDTKAKYGVMSKGKRARKD